MDSLRDLAGRLDEAAATLTAAAGAVAAAGPADNSFGVDGPGCLGELGRALSGQWLTAADARAREAAAGASLLAETAATMRTVAGSYADTDAAAGQRHGEEV